MRDANEYAGGSRRDGAGSIELQRGFAAASEGRRGVRSTPEELSCGPCEVGFAICASSNSNIIGSSPHSIIRCWKG